jgi:energy-coupling factor transporter ATP-binding protein EcfA2
VPSTVSGSTKSGVPPRPEVVLAADGVAVRFPRAVRDAVHDVSLTLRAGERLALLGPSGSGKTTLALALLGAIPTLVPATRRGEVRWAGLGDRALAAGTGVAAAVLQDTDAQLVALTVEDEIAFALENRGLSAEAIEARVTRSISRAPALGLARRDRTLTLSGGWRQRLALAAALAEEAGTLVIDEPVAHLDGEAAADAVAAVEAACRDGAAALLVEHRIDHIVHLADRVLVLGRDGRPAAQGETDATLRSIADSADSLALRLPASVRVAAALTRAGIAPDASPSDPRALPVVLAALGFDRLPRPSVAGAPLLSIERAALRRSGRTVLDDVDLTVREGEVVGLIGRNGAGKTSLGLLAVGALSATRGEVRRLGGSEPIYVPQNPALAFASGSLQGEATRRGLAWPDAAVAIAATGLSPDPDRHPLAFSHGERRRIALALAVAVPGQRLVVLDEPASGLDGIGLAALERDIETLRAHGSAIIVIAHDLDWMARIADRIALIEAGRVLASGPSLDILEATVAGRLPLPAPPVAALAARLGWTFAAAQPC